MILCTTDGTSVW